MDKLSIRPFRFPQDYAAALKIWEAMEKGVRVGRSDSLDEIQKKTAHDPDLFLVAEVDGVMAGTVIGGFDGRRGLLYHLAVLPAFRQHGIASRLMDEVEARLRAKGCLKCYLLVTADNDEAARYYEKRGWGHMNDIRLYGKELH